MEYTDKKWKEFERKAEKIEKIVRTISGWATVIFFILILGKAGASDCGGTVGRNFPVNIYLLRIDDPILPYMGGCWRQSYRQITIYSIRRRKSDIHYLRHSLY